MAATVTIGTEMKTPMIPAVIAADRQRDDDRDRVDVDRAAHDDRIEQVALDLLDRDHQAEHDGRGHDAAVDERDEHGGQTGAERADQRHERGQEREQHERDDERDAEDRQAGADHRRVGDADEDEAADVAGQRGVGAARELVEPRRAGGRRTCRRSSARCPGRP